jgi:hypothetical protein
MRAPPPFKLADRQWEKSAECSRSGGAASGSHDGCSGLTEQTRSPPEGLVTAPSGVRPLRSRVGRVVSPGACPAGHAPANPGPLGFKISVKAAVVVRVAHREPPAGPLRPPRPPAACLHVAQGASAGTSTPPAPPADPCVCQGETINENLIPQGLQPTSPKAHPVTPPDPLATLGALRR